MGGVSRTILVTGASKGIGRAVALRLAQDGFTVAVHYGRDADGAKGTMEAVENETEATARALAFDVSDRAACRAALEADMAEHGAYYGIVLNAGITRDAPFPGMEDEDWDAVLGTNLDGFYNVLRPTVLPMVQARRGGRIVAMSSVSGLSGNRGQVNYSAAKAGIIGAAKALALELARRNITVNCVAPGLIETDMIRDVPRDEVMGLIPMRRIGQAREVAAAVSFFCSDDAAYVTRQVLSVNGGMY